MVELSQIKTIAVIGAGTMGREIAQVALMAGFNTVVLNDTKGEVLEDARSYIENGLKRLESKGRLDESASADGLMQNLKLDPDLSSAVTDTDFIIEAIPEVMELKQELFKQLGALSPAHAILATNTSTMSITEIGSKSERQDKVIGMHFFIPIPVLRLIEIIRGKHTSDETVKVSVDVAQSFPALKGKRVTPVIEKESPGFIVNRLTGASSIYLNWLLDHAFENGIPCEQIDADVADMQALGPFAKWDYLGLETVYNVFNYFSKTLSSDFNPGKTISRLVKEGNLGRKTGRGIYEWKDGKPLMDTSKKCGLFDLELFMAIQLNEGCRLLEEGIVSGYKIIDDAMMAGMDMPGPFGPGKRNHEKWSQLLSDFARNTNIPYLEPCELMKTGKFKKLRK
jgi:enoyl-CoA hydratase / 3-hydroxyacyl-CoA dehydrogenase